MQSKIKTNLLQVILLFAVALVGCAVEISTTLPPATQGVQPTLTISTNGTAISTLRSVSVTPTLKPSNTPHSTRTSTPTATLLATSTSETTTHIGFDELPSLSDVVVTNADFSPGLFPFPYILTQSPTPIQLDVTSELSDQCSKDCTKRVWVVDDYSKLTLMMIRTPSASQAVNAVEYQWKTFTANEDEIIETLNDFSGAQDNDWLAYKWNDWAFASTRGPVFLLLLWHIDWEGDIDGYWTAVELAALGQLQLEKLENAGYPP